MGLKRRVNLDGVEVLRYVAERVESAWLRLRVDDPVPVFVRPTGGPDTDHGFDGDTRG